MDDADPMHRLRFVEAILNVVGKTALNRFRTRGFAARATGRQDLVSDVDRATWATLREALTNAFPPRPSWVRKTATRWEIWIGS